MSTNTQRLLSFILIIFAAISITSCFGPFYTQLATYYVQKNKQDWNVKFEGYNLSLHVVSVESNNIKGINDFSFLIRAKSIIEYGNAPQLDTIQALKMEPICVSFFTDDTSYCLENKTNWKYEISFFDKKIQQVPKWGAYYEGPSMINYKKNDSILVTFKAILYSDRQYSNIISEKEFSSVLYRKYKKTIPLSD